MNSTMPHALRILIAPDHYKGSMSAPAAAQIMQQAFARHFPGATFDLLPLADGGEGTAAAFQQAKAGLVEKVAVRDPLGRWREADLVLLDAGKTAVVEMAQASGLLLLRPEERNPLQTSSHGTGELLRAALERGAETILIGLGGSATNDGGMGMLTALGARFYDAKGKELSATGKDLARVAKADFSQLHPRLAEVHLLAICDVDNPLLGPTGATQVYGPQKGADAAALSALEAGMRNYLHHLEADSGKALAALPGAGAAGGLGMACLFLGAQLRSGIGVIAELLQLEERIAAADLVITGEGCIDEQTLHGKTIAGVLRVAQRQARPVVVIAGALRTDVETWRKLGATAVFSSVASSAPEADLLASGPSNLERTASSVAATLACGLGLAARTAQA
ncbi:glycerate kinase [Candidatus Igneacidithiobacillus taiwanensis]|uniref:glycerate kinase n=1 Tax=Candidatus Igneacidithiobacillus taiwanensis TaxID=1945924 RepID=UPI0028A0906A|nr:glycerate kinase [Candidatus Igneacidithiobacillus taiwanensis]MCE5359718.1 glycerate kinase [Acidithiobacillus sp.]